MSEAQPPVNQDSALYNPINFSEASTSSLDYASLDARYLNKEQGGVVQGDVFVQGNVYTRGATTIIGESKVICNDGSNQATYSGQGIQIVGGGNISLNNNAAETEPDNLLEIKLKDADRLVVSKDGDTSITGTFSQYGRATLGQRLLSSENTEVYSEDNTAYIDFHSRKFRDNDYDTRIKSTGGSDTGLSGKGTLNLEASIYNLDPGDVVLPTGSIYFARRTAADDSGRIFYDKTRRVFYIQFTPEMRWQALNNFTFTDMLLLNKDIMTIKPILNVDNRCTLGRRLNKSVEIDSSVVSAQAFVDFHSNPNVVNDYDARVMSLGGQDNVSGKADLQLEANRYLFNGGSILMSGRNQSIWFKNDGDSGDRFRLHMNTDGNDCYIDCQKSLSIRMDGSLAGLQTVFNASTDYITHGVAMRMHGPIGKYVMFHKDNGLRDVSFRPQSWRMCSTGMDGDWHYLGLDKTTSDLKTKQNIEDYDVEDLANRFRNLRPVSYEFKDRYKAYNKNPHGTRNIGFIAQEVEEHIPELVVELEDPDKPDETLLTWNEGYMTVHNTMLIHYLLKKIESLEAKLSCMTP